MSIDLEGALADLARSVHDDGVADRMNGQVRHMVGRIRRRRAARYSATGVIGAGAVAALAVGGMQLADRFPAAVPPAATDPTPDGASDGLSLECGDRVPADALRPEWEGFRLELEVSGPAAGSDVPVVVRLVNDGNRYFGWDTTQIVQLAALRDGEIVATGTKSAPSGRFSPDSAWSAEELVSLSECAGEGGFGAGDYELVASALLANADGSEPLGLSAGPVPFTIAEAPSRDTPDGDAAILAIIAESERISAKYPFGVCGTRVPVEPSDLLTIDMQLDSLSYAPGSLMEGTAAITAIDGLTVLGNSPVTAAHVVLVRDGVVVGRGHYDPEHIALNTFSAAEPYPLPALGNALLCSLPGAPATELELPPGTYQAYATLEVALKEVQFADGSAESRSDLIVARSRPVDVTIG